MIYVLYEEVADYEKYYIWSVDKDINDIERKCRQLNGAYGWALRKFDNSLVLIRVFSTPSEAEAFIEASK